MNYEKVDHPTVVPTEARFERTFRAQEKFRISSATFQSTSAKKITQGPDLAIIEDGARVIVRSSEGVLHPIIYVRGYAMSRSEIDDTAADPFCASNVGSTVSAPRTWCVHLPAVKKGIRA